MRYFIDAYAKSSSYNGLSKWIGKLHYLDVTLLSCYFLLPCMLSLYGGCWFFRLPRLVIAKLEYYAHVGAGLCTDSERHVLRQHEQTERVRCFVSLKWEIGIPKVIWSMLIVGYYMVHDINYHTASISSSSVRNRKSTDQLFILVSSQWECTSTAPQPGHEWGNERPKVGRLTCYPSRVRVKQPFNTSVLS